MIIVSKFSFPKNKTCRINPTIQSTAMIVNSIHVPDNDSSRLFRSCVHILIKALRDRLIKSYDLMISVSLWNEVATILVSCCIDRFYREMNKTIQNRTYEK